MKSKVKKWGSLFMGTLVLSSVVVGCTKNEDTSKEASSTAQETKKESTKEKIVIGIPTNPNVTDFETNTLTMLIEEQMNVDLEFMLLPGGAEAKTKLSLMVSSGSALPDVINMGLDYLTTKDYGEKGVFIKTTDYYKDPNISPNFNEIEEETRDYILKDLDIEGDMYGLFSFNQTYWNEGAYRTWINKEWLDKLNLEEPKTTDEFYNVLKAFAENDLNENNKKDEIAMMGSKNGWGQDPTVFLMNAFVQANPSTNYLYLENGKIIPAYMKEEWKQGLEYIGKLIEEGLLSSLSYTQDGTQLKSITTAEVPIIGVVPSASLTVFSPKQLENMVLLAPLEGPNGVSFTPYAPSAPNNTWYITKDCKNPELAFKIGDNFLSNEMYMRARYGEKGVNWTDDPEVCAEWEGKYEATKGIKAAFVELDSLWSKPQNVIWQGNHPQYAGYEIDWSTPIMPKSEVATTKKQNAGPVYEELYTPKFPKEYIPELKYSQEEIERLSILKTSINEFVNAKTVGFITGNVPFSEWDNYLNELNKMGIEEYIAMVQTAYDRQK